MPLALLYPAPLKAWLPKPKPQWSMCQTLHKTLDVSHCSKENTDSTSEVNSHGTKKKSTANVWGILAMSPSRWCNIHLHCVVKPCFLPHDPENQSVATFQRRASSTATSWVTQRKTGTTEFLQSKGFATPNNSWNICFSILEFFSLIFIRKGIFKASF